MSVENNDLITVEVAYALPELQSVITIKVKQGTTALQAILQSGILEQHTEINLSKLTVGIFGKHVKSHCILKAHDRVEIYRSLLINPKEARRLRAATQNKKTSINNSGSWHSAPITLDNIRQSLAVLLLSLLEFGHHLNTPSDHSHWPAACDHPPNSFDSSYALQHSFEPSCALA